MGNFELDLTLHLFGKFIAVVSSILLYHMNGRRDSLFAAPFTDYVFLASVVAEMSYSPREGTQSCRC